MGRAKVPLKKIENTTARKVTFSKRRKGLIKKAYELSVLCDIEVAIIMFSPSGVLSHFSAHRRIEDVLKRYLRLSDQEKTPADKDNEKKDGTHNVVIPNKENLISLLENLKVDEDMVRQASSSNNQASSTPNLAEISKDLPTKDINQELLKSKARLEELNETTRFLFGDLHKLHHTHQELEEREMRLMEVLSRVRERKKYLITNSSTRAASMPLPSIPQHRKLLQMQSQKEGTFSLMQQESPFIQQTKASKEKILMQPPFERILDMKEEVVMEGNYNEAPKYQNQTSVFNDKAVQTINNPMGPPKIAFGNFQDNPWKQTWKYTNIPQHRNVLQTTQGLVQMQSQKEGTSSLMQQESPFIQQTKTSKEKILMQPPFERILDMKEEVVMEGNYNEAPKYQNQTSVFHDKAVQTINNPMGPPNIGFGSFQDNPWKQPWKYTNTTWNQPLPTTDQFPLF